MYKFQDTDFLTFCGKDKGAKNGTFSHKFHIPSTDDTKAHFGDKNYPSRIVDKRSHVELFQNRLKSCVFLAIELNQAALSSLSLSNKIHWKTRVLANCEHFLGEFCGFLMNYRTQKGI